MLLEEDALARRSTLLQILSDESIHNRSLLHIHDGTKVNCEIDTPNYQN